MHKPEIAVFEEFADRFAQLSKEAGRDQEIIPYMMVGHPGTTLRDATALALYLKRRRLELEQVQEFTPTPMTLSTCMYYTGRDFETGKPIHVPKGREVRLQKALVQWFMPDNRKYVLEALKNAGMMDKIEELLGPRSARSAPTPSNGEKRRGVRHQT
jgi:radical SAM superfamily enzyme YgiQ (UPF0313 family)